MKLASLFSHHMVLQQGRPIPVWGWAESGQKIRVELAGHTVEAVTGEDSQWMAHLPALDAGGPYTLTVSTDGSDPLILKDVLIGEVWICSGQSNMEFGLVSAHNASEEIPRADFPQIRTFKVPKVAAIEPQPDVEGHWDVCSPKTAPSFSAVAYFFGVNLHRRLNVPVGLIHSSWGGTTAEAWTSLGGLRGSPKLSHFAETIEMIQSDDEAQGECQEQYADWVKTYVERPAPPNLGEESGWANPDADPSDWSPIIVPGHWKRSGYDFNGVLWYRREIQIPHEWAGRDLLLSIGACDKSEWTYFNGHFLGSLTMQDTPNAWSTSRVYTIPGDQVRDGKNVVCVRVYSNLYDSGMTGPAEKLFARPADEPDAEAISLNGNWTCRVEHRFDPIPPQPPGGQPHTIPSSLYNGMIAPLVPYAARGAIWYQGESNTGRAEEYRILFPTMIRDWRRNWGQESFAFHFVQLANYQAPTDDPGNLSTWAELREAQASTLSLPETGMAVILDAGEEHDIHPSNKLDVGQRLAWSALAEVYAQKDIPASGPQFRSLEKDGAELRVHFDLFGSQLASSEKPLPGFAIAGSDGIFHWAQAVVNGNTVQLTSSEVPAPKMARYAWADNPPSSLYNTFGQPAAPFRTQL